MEDLNLPLEGLVVLEMSGLAPVPYCGLILADFGATVIRVDRVVGDSIVSQPIDQLTRGKHSIAINLKHKEGVEVLRSLAKKADVLIDSYRPGVMEKLGLSPESLMSEAPRLIYARLTGFGQTGPYALRAGHDINYIALSGALSVLGRRGQAPLFPSNILGDFASGGMMCALGIMFALYERKSTGRGKLIDSSMMDGAAYLATFIYKLRVGRTGWWDNDRGCNALDSGAHFYEVYETLDHKYISVGAIEGPFYSELLKGMGLAERTDLPDQTDQTQWPRMKQLFKEIFAKKTRDEWEQIFMGTDACVAPVLEMHELTGHPQATARQLVFKGDNGLDVMMAPRLFDVQNTTKLSIQQQQQQQIDQLSTKKLVVEGANTVTVLKKFGFESDDIDRLIESKNMNRTC
ncbi:hypothetical protein PPL_11602 [Heterostelium album PN500]|uniref:Alpha-methylacyl-CoA racemase n=1 Tax=Heterostelium pallidum (strain ATCC 26659 / Pp 5 / PN500) TaxID=670386 RepID=D3BV77_HETP5|nr:hypothetical protein PPL_11602 [Heterostelium album PN500]EFA74634.1 hypothetical protein PPL_11602 [Heterostelium album PN500]|eukprot:XP_020426768.1 hypothetical protein PPL_11602 [Heterostelium album PN500]